MSSRQATSDYARIAGPAVRKVRHAVRTGRLLRTACVDCGGASLEAHHHNGYDADHALDVVWLCRPCHLARHGRKPLHSWEKHARRYMAETRGVRDYHIRERIHSYSEWTGPKRLLWHVENIWGYLATDEEREALRALVDALAAAKGDAP